jgi:hypothetical protein
LASIEKTETESLESQLIITTAEDCSESSLPFRPFDKALIKKLLKEEKSLKLLTIQLITGNIISSINRK